MFNANDYLCQCQRLLCQRSSLVNLTLILANHSWSSINSDNFPCSLLSHLYNIYFFLGVLELWYQ
jgi:hypothetical protein